MIDSIRPGTYVRFLYCETDDGDRYYYWGKVITPTEVVGAPGWTIQAIVYETEDSECQTEVTLDISNDLISDVKEHPSFGTADLMLWGVASEPSTADGETSPVRLRETTIVSDPDGLRDIAYFLLEQAEFLDSISNDERRDYHAHYRSCIGLSDIIVAGPPLEEDVE